MQTQVNSRRNPTHGNHRGFKLKHEHVTDKFSVDSVFDGKSITSSGVATFGKYNVGATASFDVAKSALKSHGVAASFTESDFTINGSITNATDIGFSVLKTCKNGDATALDITYKTSTGDNTFAVVTKHGIDDKSFVKASVDKNFVFGLGYTAKVATGLSLTLATQVDGNNLATDSHKVGVSLTWE